MIIRLNVRNVICPILPRTIRGIIDAISSTLVIRVIPQPHAVLRPYFFQLRAVRKRNFPLQGSNVSSSNSQVRYASQIILRATELAIVANGNKIMRLLSRSRKYLSERLAYS